MVFGMATIEHVKIEIEDDFMARQTRAEPVQALAELIWNSVDADASRVDVEFEFNDLAQDMSKIIVYDDGHGIPRDQAKQLFGHLGGSWKRLQRRTETKDRMVHGQEGRGRRPSPSERQQPGRLATFQRADHNHTQFLFSKAISRT